MPIRVMIRVPQFLIQVHRSHTGTNNQQLATARWQTRRHLLTDPIHLLRPLRRIRQRHHVIKNDQRRTATIDLTTHAESLNGGILLTRVSGFPTQVDLISRPLVSRSLVAISRPESQLKISIPRMSQTLLDRIQELLSLLLRLRHHQHVNVRILRHPISHIVNSDRHRLSVVRRNINKQARQTRRALLKDHTLRKPRRLLALHQLHNVIHVRPHRGPQVPLRELGKADVRAASLIHHIRLAETHLIHKSRKVRILPTLHIIPRARPPDDHQGVGHRLTLTDMIHDLLTCLRSRHAATRRLRFSHEKHPSHSGPPPKAGSRKKTGTTAQKIGGRRYRQTPRRKYPKHEPEAAWGAAPCCIYKSLFTSRGALKNRPFQGVTRLNLCKGCPSMSTYVHIKYPPSQKNLQSHPPKTPVEYFSQHTHTHPPAPP